MPPRPIKKETINGHNCATKLEQLLTNRWSRMRSDSVTIGSVDYESDEADETASWTDVEETVAGVRWLVPSWLPYGMVTGVIAEPKVGKSAFVLGALVRPIVCGGNWFNDCIGPGMGNVLWCDTEGRAAINIERARAWGLPKGRIKVPFKDRLQRVNLKDADHLARIESVVCRYSTPLVVIDSLRGAHSDDENNSKVGQILQSLTEIAERTNAAIVLIHHTKKLFEGEELTANSGRGSNAFLAMVACQIAVDRPDAKSEWRRAQVLGENLGTAPPPMGFRITSKGLEFGQPPEKPRKETQKGNAKEWLLAYMTPGVWYDAAEIETSAPFTETALRRARDELGIVKPDHLKFFGKNKGWKWKLPVPEEGKSKAAKTAQKRATP